MNRGIKIAIRNRPKKDPAFRAALLSEAVSLLMANHLETDKAVLREYISATIGFRKLAQETEIPRKTLKRIVRKDGDPKAGKVFSIIAALQKATGVRLKVSASASK